MIRKLKLRFIFLSMAALFILLFAIITGINGMNYNTVITHADDTLSMISQNRGTFPRFEGKDGPRHLSPEAPYESRYFSVVLNEKGETVQADTSRIQAVDTQTAIEYAKEAVSTGKAKGFIRPYRFYRSEEEDGTRVTFLDCSTEFDSFYRFLIISIFMAVIGYILFFFVILFFSGKMLRPVEESIETQKRFITDAGHEIKTPLSVIRADLDVMEMEAGESEWIEDARAQVTRLTALTNDLVYLSRMEEKTAALQMAEFAFSDMVGEMAASFRAPAQAGNKKLCISVQPRITLTGDEKALRQLVSILLDNAVKYTPEEGCISVCLQKKGKLAVMQVSNTTKEPVSQEQTRRIFDRFYRIDSSRNTQTGGYGIGLSIARAIVSAHKGRIQAAAEDKETLIITVCLPTG